MFAYDIAGWKALLYLCAESRKGNSVLAVGSEAVVVSCMRLIELEFEELDTVAEAEPQCAALAASGSLSLCLMQ